MFTNKQFTNEQIVNRRSENVEHMEDLYISDQGLNVAMEKIRKNVRSVLREEAVAHGLTYNEIEVMISLVNGLDTAGEIARSRGISRSLVSKSVESLVKKGYIETRQDGSDRRVIRLIVLPKALDMVQQLNRKRQSLLEGLMNGVDPREAEIFLSVLTTILKNIDRLTPESGNGAGKE